MSLIQEHLEQLWYHLFIVLAFLVVPDFISSHLTETCHVCRNGKLWGFLSYSFKLKRETWLPRVKKKKNLEETVYIILTSHLAPWLVVEIL